jgi:hypothetical protein
MTEDPRYPGPNIDVAYNIKPGDPSYDWMPCELAPFLTKPDVPSIKQREQLEINTLTFDEIYAFMRSNNIPLFDNILYDEVFGFNSVNAERGDRTLELAARPYPLLSDQFVVMLQQRILSRFPLWRVKIGTIGKFVLYIYPDAMKLWPQLRAVAGHDPLEIWRREAERQFTTNEADQRRQFVHVRNVLPNIMVDWKADSRCHLVAAFGSYDGNDQEWSYWFLVRGPTGSEFMIGRDDAATGSSYPVYPNGRLGRFIVWLYAGNGKHIQKVNEFDIWLQQMIVPAGTCKLDILNTADRKAIQTVTVSPDALIEAWYQLQGTS